MEKRDVVLKKEGSLLKFCIDGDKSILYDFKTNKYTSIKGNEVKISTIKGLFSKYTTNRIDADNSDNAYLNLFRIIKYDSTFNKKNLGSLLEDIHRFKYTEALLSQGFSIDFKVREGLFNNVQKLEKKYKNMLKDIKNPPIDRYSFWEYNNLEFYHRFYTYLKDRNEDMDNRLLVSLCSKGYDIHLLINNYKYNIDSLCNYVYNIARYEALNYGDVITYLKDYMTAKNSVQDRISKINKYPKNLHTQHDIAIRYMSIAKTTYDDIEFKTMIDKSLEYKNNRYIITNPNETKDLKLEGRDLNHCVASYINDVIKGRCKILFMRYKDKPNESLVTLEIRGKSIVQAKGYLNRDLSEEEKEFLNEYCNKKQIKLHI